MADYYISSVNGTDVGPPAGTSWGTAFATLATCDSTITPAANDVFHFDSNHVEAHTGTDLNLNSSRTADENFNLPVYISQTYNTTTYARGAKINTTGNYHISMGGNGQSVMSIGLEFETNSDNLNAGCTDGTAFYYDCGLTQTGNNSNDMIGIGGGGRTVFVGCDFSLAHVTQAFSGGVGGIVEFYDCTWTCTVGTSTKLFTVLGDSTKLIIDGCDFSDATYLSDDVHVASIDVGAGYVSVSNSKIPASFSSSSLLNAGSRIEAYNSGSSADNNGVHVEDAYGVLNDDIATYLTATYDGTNEYSLKLVTTANGFDGFTPFRFKLCEVWAASASTITVEMLETSASAITGLTDAQAWLELASTATTGPKGDVTNTRDANYGIGATPSTLTSSSASWTIAGSPANTDKRKIAVTAPSGEAGVYSVYVNIACAAVRTLYFDPDVTVS